MRTLLVLLAAVLLLLQLPVARASVRVYPAPAGEPLSGAFTVTADGNAVPVYPATVCNVPAASRPGLDGSTYYLTPSNVAKASFATFDLSGTATVRVTCPSTVTNAKILPSSLGIVPAVSGTTVTFPVSAAAQLTLEVNGNYTTPLHLFVNPFETSVPSPADPNVLYYGPGVHHLTANVQVGDGMTIYVAGGAVVYGSATDTDYGGIFKLTGSHITLRGRGIIDGSLAAQGSEKMIVMSGGTDLNVEGVILRDAANWNIMPMHTAQVTVANVKEISFRGGSDGVDICSCSDVRVTGSFFRTFDDLVVVKTKFSGEGEAYDVTVSGCVLWNELAHALSVGAEMLYDAYDITFENCDVIHDKGRAQLLAVDNSDSGNVHDVTWSNIRVEESRKLMSLAVSDDTWSTTATRGQVNNATFEAISAPSAATAAYLAGYGASSPISNTVFRGVLVGGAAVTPAMVSRNAYVHTVSYGLLPVADTYVQDGGDAGVNLSGGAEDIVKLDASGANRETFLRFNVAGLSAATAFQLAVVPTSVGAAATTLSYDVAANDAWTEAGLTWNTKPGSSSTAGTEAGYAQGVPVVVDATAAAHAQASGDGLISFRIRSTTYGSNNWIHLGSRHNPSPVYLPELEYTVP